MNYDNNNQEIVGYDSNTGMPISANQNLYNGQQVVPNNQPVVLNNQPMISNNQSQLISPYDKMNHNVNDKKKKSYSTKWILLIIAILTIVIVGVLIIIKNVRPTNSTRTIMIYMVGANLESESGLATIDLNGIDYNLMDNENVNVVVIAGGSKRWFNDYIAKDETSIYELTSNGYTKVKQQTIQNMGSSQVLSSFLSYVYNNYKTDEYDLIFWNHGAAIYGSETDELSNDTLSLAELDEALAVSPFSNKNKLELVIYRTCLNGTIEVASILDEYADYLVASEEITRGFQGADALNFINKINTSDTAYDIGTKFINSYKGVMAGIKQEFIAKQKVEYLYSTYSIVDLKHIDKLSSDVNDFFGDIDVSSNYNLIAKVRSNLYQYAYTGSENNDPSYDMVDLYNLVKELRDLSPTKADKLLKNIENTILYNYATNDQSRGLSIYFPYNGSDKIKTIFLNVYSNFGSFKNYYGFITKFNKLQNSSSSSFSFASNKISVNTENGEADFTLELNDEQKEGFAKASYIVFKDNKDGYYLPVYRGNQVKLEGNTLKANIKDRQLKVVSTVDGLEGDLTLIEQDETDTYIKYNTIVTAEDLSAEDFSGYRFDVVTLSLIYDKASGEVNIGSAMLNSADELIPSSAIVNLKDYTHIIFASSKYRILDANGNYDDNWESNRIMEGIEEKVGKFEFKLQNFTNTDDYYCVFIIWDTYNKVYYSNLVKMK